MIMFVDCEASSLDADSWPVEVGMAWLAEGRVETRSSLIRPDPSWSMRAWSPASAEIHGIAMEELRRAPPAAEVARWVAGMFGDATVVSDAPEWDGRWLARLYETADGLRLPLVRDFDVLVAARCDMAATRRVYAALDRIAAPAPRRPRRRASRRRVVRRAGGRAMTGRMSVEQFVERSPGLEDATRREPHDGRPAGAPVLGDIVRVRVPWPRGRRRRGGAVRGLDFIVEFRHPPRRHLRRPAPECLGRGRDRT